MPAYGPAAWGLTKNPFACAVQPLAPPQDLDQYFDFYKWYDQASLSKLDARGRIDRWNIAASRTTTFLVSGPGGCGRTSLENLLLYELGVRSPKPPIVIAHKLEVSRIGKQAVGQSLAQSLLFGVRKVDVQAAELLSQTLKDWKEFLLPGTTPDVDNLLAEFKQAIVAAMPDTKIVISFDARDHTISHDHARDAVELVQNVADVVLLLVTSRNHASYIRNGLAMQQRPVAWVDAPHVDAAVTARFLEERLDRQRQPGVAAPHPLFPFTAAAVSKIFQPTPGREAVTLPIRVAIQKLATAMERKEAELRAHPAGKPDITDADMQQSF